MEKKILLPELSVKMDLNGIPSYVIKMECFPQSLHEYLKEYNWDTKNLDVTFKNRELICDDIVEGMGFCRLKVSIELFDTAV